MLDGNNGFSLKIGNIGMANTVLWAVDKHPSKVRKEETTVSAIGILVGIGPAMMGTMAARPPVNGTFNSTTACKAIKPSKRKGSSIGTMGPQTMITYLRKIVISTTFYFGPKTARTMGNNNYQL